MNPTPSGENPRGRRKPLVNKKWCTPPTATDICKCQQPEGEQIYSSGTLTHQFPYRDLNGARLFSRFRYQVTDKESPEYPKTFRYCAHYEKTNPEHKAALYGLPRVAESKAAHIPKIYLAEGESDAEAGWERGAYVSTAHTGTNFYAEQAEHYAGYDGIVYILVDRDHEDPKHRANFAKGLDYPGTAAALRKYRALKSVGVKAFFREAVDGKDLRDHFAKGYEIEDLRKVSADQIKARAPKEYAKGSVKTMQLRGDDLPEGPGMQNFILALERRGYLVIPLGGGRYKTNCPHPEHEDRNPSFEFEQGEKCVVGTCRSRDCTDDNGWAEICEELDVKASDTFNDAISKRTPQNGGSSIDVTSAADARVWLRDTIGGGRLSGFFVKRGQIVHTARVGEEGYIEISKAEEDIDGAAQVRAASADYIAARVDDEYDCVKYRTKKDGSLESVSALFPDVAVKRVIANPASAANLRLLRGVVHVPAIRPDGSVMYEPGYDEATSLLYSPEAGLVIPEIPNKPTAAQVRKAVEVISTPIAEVPFVTDHDRANWWGAMITPMVRTLLPPPYKFALMEASQPGSGKTNLANMIREVFGGVFRSEVPDDESELRKQITSILSVTTGAVVVLDNISGKFRSSTFAGLITSDTWDDRPLGMTDLRSYDNDRLWVGTGNNVALGGDMPRRTIRVRIDHGVPNPEKLRFDFDPLMWMRENKAKVIHAILTIVRAWIVAGKPMEPRTTSDGFAAWVQGIRGILQFAEVPGIFDHDMTQIQVGTDDDSWGPFYEAVHGKFGDKEWTTGDVLRLISPLKMRINDDDAVDVEPDMLSPAILPEELAADYDRNGQTISLSISQKLGRRLKERNGRWSGSYCVRVSESRSKTKKFSIVKYVAKEQN